jgi:hypothetical protein
VRYLAVGPCSRSAVCIHRHHAMLSTRSMLPKRWYGTADLEVGDAPTDRARVQAIKQ